MLSDPVENVGSQPESSSSMLSRLVDEVGTNGIAPQEKVQIADMVKKTVP